MPPTMKDLGIDKLSVADRLALVEEIWDSIAASADQIPLTDAQRQEIERRAEELRSNPEIGIPWEVVRDEALARLRR